MKLTKIPRSFYLQSTVKVASQLLGKYFVRRIDDQFLIGRFVEAEAYCKNDPASHSFRGMTQRNRTMFALGGHLYVYFTYGMHYCANIVTGKNGIGEAVLIRAVEPVDGLDIITKNRGFPKDDVRLTNGPAKFCEAFSLTKTDDGIDLTGDLIYIAENPDEPRHKISRSRRIGITNGKNKLWRFFIKGNAWVSKEKR
jgi:DNA-3-methyladenine glycosylase